MKKRIAMALVLLLAVAVPCMFLARGPTGRTYNMPYHEAEARLFASLNLDKSQTTTNPLSVQASLDGALARTMSMNGFAVDLHEYVPDTVLSLTCHHLYNIGAVGGEYIHFALRMRTDSSTQVTVDYSNKWRGMWPPFVFWNPGKIRERRVHKLIWQRHLPTTESNATSG